VIFVFIRGLEIRLEARVLIPERIHVDDHVLHGFEVRHRVDLDRIVGAHHVAERRLAREAGDPVDVHRARTADRGAARAAERDRSVDFRFRVLEGVEYGLRIGKIDIDAVAMWLVVGGGVESEEVERYFRHAISTISLRACTW
jgi:hypothetical protein